LETNGYEAETNGLGEDTSETNGSEETNGFGEDMNETNGSEETNGFGEDMSETNGSEERSFEIPGAIKLTIEDKFLSPEEVLALMHTHRPSGKNIPRGIKENVAFVLENENNLTRKENGKRACYVDDCGAWSRNGSAKTHHYVLKQHNKLDYVDKKDGKYVRFVKGKRVPIEPQPAADAIIVFKWYYITLKRDPSYKRRISFLTQCPENMESMKNLAVVEYIGAFCQKPEPHGNSKKTTIVSMSVHHAL
jgi:hypothetical protein